MNLTTSLRFNKYQAIQFVAENLASAPSAPNSANGMIYYDTATFKIRFYLNGTWTDFDSGGAGGGDASTNTATSVDNEIVLFSLTTGKLLKRATTTGIAKLTSGVLSAAVAGTDYTTPSSTESFTNKTFNANGTGNSITNIETADFAANVVDTDGTLAANSATRIPAQSAVKTYVDNAVAGLDWKDSVRAATTAAGTLASSFANGQTIDGVVLATNDRILIKNQAAGAENGIYIVQASGAPVRATDADSSLEVWNLAVYVRQGTALAGSNWTNTNTTAPTVGSTVLTFAQFSGQVQPAASESASGIIELATVAEVLARADTVRAVTPAGLINFARVISGQIGDGTTNPLPFTHNFNTRNVVVSLRKVSTNEQWIADVTCDTVNRVLLAFGTIPTTNEFEVTVTG